MLDINLIREEPDRLRNAMEKRQMDPSSVSTILELDEKRRTLIQEVGR